MNYEIHKPVKVYKYGNFDALATYKPIIYAKLVEINEKVNNFFENH